MQVHLRQRFPFLMQSKVLRAAEDEMELEVLFSPGDFYFNRSLSSVPLFVLTELMGQGAEKLLTASTGQKGKYFLTGIDQFVLSESMDKYVYDSLRLNICLKQRLMRYYQSYARIYHAGDEIASALVTHYFSG